MASENWQLVAWLLVAVGLFGLFRWLRLRFESRMTPQQARRHDKVQAVNLRFHSVVFGFCAAGLLFIAVATGVKGDFAFAIPMALIGVAAGGGSFSMWMRANSHGGTDE